MVELNCEDVAQWKVFWLEKLDPIFKYFFDSQSIDYSCDFRRTIQAS